MESPDRYDLAHYPPLQRVADAWTTIRDEVAGKDRSEILPINRENKDYPEVLMEYLAMGRPGWIEGWGANRHLWLNYGIVIEDQTPIPDPSIPDTLAILRRVRGLRVAALSLFRPGAHLPPHRHPELAEEGLYTFHLGLEGPADYAYLYTEERFVKEEPGKGFVFDGSKPHFAFNFSKRDRLILYVEFYRERLAWVDDAASSVG